MSILTFVGGAIDPSRPALKIDPLLDGTDDGAFPFVFDLLADYQASHAAVAYLNGDVIADLSEGGAGAMTVTAPSAVTSRAAIGGADFSDVTTKPNVVAGPDTALAGIHGGNQYFGVVSYLLLPKYADLNNTSTIMPFFAAADAATGYLVDPELVSLHFSYSPPTYYVEARRQTAIGAQDGVHSALPDYTDADNLPGSIGANEQPIMQVAYDRNSVTSDIRIRLISQANAVAGGAATDVPVVSLASPDENTADFSAKTPKWGIPNTFWASPPSASRTFVVLRGYIRNLEISPPDAFFAEADADWNRVVARIKAMLT